MDMKNQQKLFLYSDYVRARDHWSQTFLKAEMLKTIWNRDPFSSEIQKWDVSSPNPFWFKDDAMSKIKIARAHYDGEFIEFIGGRHRTLWMLRQGVKNIPISLTAKGYFEAGLSGLLVRRCFDGEPIT